jgi:sec-independent protein translocase protein TatA
MVAMLSSPVDLAMLLLLALLLFGAKRLPEIARSLGVGMREFKDSIDGVTDPDASEPPAQAVAAASIPPPASSTQESSSEQAVEREPVPPPSS